MKKIKILVTIAFLLISCQQNIEKIEKEYLDKAIKEANVESNYQWVVILPGLGCHGCIQEAEYFMSKHITDKRILFVLTNISSLKILQQKTEIRIDEHTNIYIDRISCILCLVSPAVFLIPVLLPVIWQVFFRLF